MGGWAQGVPAATCAKKRTRSPSGRASILKKGLAALHDLPSLKKILLDLVDDGAATLAPRGRNVLRPVASISTSPGVTGGIRG
jgi:hypothetical protein